MSIKVGDKFIIEIGTIAELPDGKKKYFIKPFESLVFDKTGLAQLEPIEKAWENELEKTKLVAYKDGFKHGKLWAIEEYDNGYNNALADVNHAIDVLKGMLVKECEEWFEGCEGIDDVICSFTIQRIIDTTKAYEEKKKAEEFKIGDEVETEGRYKAIVAYIYDRKVADLMFSDGSTGKREIESLSKTGRNFGNEVEQLLDKLRGKE